MSVVTIMLVHAETCWKGVYDSSLTFQDRIKRVILPVETGQFGVTAVDKSMSQC